MIELLLFALAGIALGTFSGLVPGIHVNTISLAALGLAAFFNPAWLVAFIVATAVTHTFWDFVPSILLGAPSDDTALAVLPGHRLLLSGNGVDAIRLTIVGGLGAVFFAAALMPVFLLALPLMYSAVHGYIHFLLAGIAIYMVWLEPGWKKAAGAAVFLLSGTLGYIILNMPVLPVSLSLFPLFTGLFGISGLAVSIGKKTSIPEQKPARPIQGKFALKGILKGLLSGALVGTLPALGASQATILSQQISRGDEREFLVSVGAINTVVAIFSLVSLYTISKARSGAAVAVAELLPDFGFQDLVSLVAVAMLAAGVSSFAMLKSTERIVKFMAKANYAKLSWSIITLLVGLVAFLSGPFGLAILAVSTATGIAAILLGVKRSLMMGCLMLPLILFYSGLVT